MSTEITEYYIYYGTTDSDSNRFGSVKLHIKLTCKFVTDIVGLFINCRRFRCRRLGVSPFWPYHSGCRRFGLSPL